MGTLSLINFNINNYNNLLCSSTTCLSTVKNGMAVATRTSVMQFIDTGEIVMRKQTILSAVLAVALIPAAGMSAEKGSSFEKDAQLCDSWTWLDDSQAAGNLNTAATESNSEKIAFGDARYNIGW